MKPDRFRTLAEAYGADMRRWPASEHEAAQALLAQGDATLAAMLADATALDALLVCHQVAPPDMRLVHAVTASAMPDRAPVRGRMRRWWTGLGLASLGLAGAAVGAIAVAAVVPATSVSPENDSAGWLAPGTVFSPLASEGNEP